MIKSILEKLDIEEEDLRLLTVDFSDVKIYVSTITMVGHKVINNINKLTSDEYEQLVECLLKNKDDKIEERFKKLENRILDVENKTFLGGL